MKLYRLERDQFLPVSIETAWEFFSDPRNLPQITPDWLDFKITNRFGLFGQILHHMVIGSKLNEIFDYRRTALEAIFGSCSEPP